MSFKGRPESLLPPDAASSSARSQVLDLVITDRENTMPDHDEGELSSNSERYSDEEEYYSARETLRTPSEDLHGHGRDPQSQSGEGEIDAPEGTGDEARSGGKDATQGVNINAVYTSLEHSRKMVDARGIETALDKLHPVPNTNYDTQGRHGCVEGTRTSILDELLDWAQDPLAPTIFWLSGMAGTGKTTIAWSFSDRLHSRGLLGGTFFCSRIGPPEHADITRIIPTLAYHLAYSSDAYRFGVVDQIDSNPDITQKSISKQLDVLFRQPFSALSHTDAASFVLIIDALDECSNKDATVTMIELLMSASSNIPVKFLVTSRPERHIRETQLSHHDYSRILRLHEIEQSTVDHDISVYLTMHLHNVRHTPQDVDTLVHLANGLFIFASTSIAYITRRNSVERLERLTRLAQPTALSTKPLDEMYALIIKEASEDVEDSELAPIKQILATILALRARISINGLSEFLGVEPRYLRDTLEHLHAVLFVPEQDEDAGLGTLHTSFVDFLTNPERAPSHLLIDVSAGHMTLARGCFNAIYLGEICSEIVYLKPGYIYTSDASDALIYAVKGWSHHAEESRISHWIEAMEFLALRNENYLRTPMEELWEQHRDLADELQCTAVQFNMVKKWERQKETATFNETQRRRNLAIKFQRISTSVQTLRQSISTPLWPGAEVDFALRAIERSTEHHLLGNESIDDVCAQSQRTVEQIPDGHPDKPRLLNTLSGELRDWYDSDNARYNDSLTDALVLALRAVALIQDNNESKLFLTESLESIGRDLKERFDYRYTLEDLDHAISVKQRVVDLTPDGHPEKPIRLNHLGVFFWDRFNSVGNLEDIEDAIAAQRCAVDLAPDGDSSKPLSLSNLGTSFSSRFNRVGNIEDIEDAIAAQRRAVDLTPDGHPDKPIRLNNLGQSLLSRFERVGNLEDMENAIAVLRGAVALIPDGHPSKPLYLSNLGTSFSSRFNRVGNLEDIEDAIAAQRRAVDLFPEGHLNKLLSLNNLGLSLSSRFWRVGDLEDIDGAIAVQHCAVDLIPDGHPNKPLYLSSLGASLLSCFSRVGKLEYIHSAVAAQRRAVDLTSDGHPSKPLYLNNLGTSLSSCFGGVGNLEDIEGAIAALRRAVDLTPDGHPDKPPYLNNLGQSLLSRFNRVGNLKDMEDGIAVLRGSVDLVPDGHPNKPLYLSNLGTSFSSRFNRIGNLEDIEYAITAQRRAVDLFPEGHLSKPLSLNNLGTSLLSRFRRVGNLEDIEDAIVILRRAVDLTPDDHPNKPLCLSNLGTSFSSRFNQAGNLEDIDDAIAASRRAVDITPDGHPNKPAYHDFLGNFLSRRFKKRGNLHDIEDAIIAYRYAVDHTPDDHPNKSIYAGDLREALKSQAEMPRSHVY